MLLSITLICAASYWVSSENKMGGQSCNGGRLWRNSLSGASSVGYFAEEAIDSFHVNLVVNGRGLEGPAADDDEAHWKVEEGAAEDEDEEEDEDEDEDEVKPGSL